MSKHEYDGIYSSRTINSLNGKIVATRTMLYYPVTVGISVCPGYDQDNALLGCDQNNVLPGYFQENVLPGCDQDNGLPGYNQGKVLLPCSIRTMDYLVLVIALSYLVKIRIGNIVLP